MWCARRRHGWARCITEPASKPGWRCPISHIECPINRAAGGSANVFWQRRSGAFARAPRAIPEPRCGLKRTVRWLMSVVRCGNFKRRCGKSLSTVKRDRERAFVAPSRLAPAPGDNLRTGRSRRADRPTQSRGAARASCGSRCAPRDSAPRSTSPPLPTHQIPPATPATTLPRFRRSPVSSHSIATRLFGRCSRR